MSASTLPSDFIALLCSMNAYDKYVANLWLEDKGIDDVILDPEIEPKDYLVSSFRFAETPEGCTFWGKVNNAWLKKLIDAPRS